MGKNWSKQKIFKIARVFELKKITQKKFQEKYVKEKTTKNIRILNKFICLLRS